MGARRLTNWCDDMNELEQLRKEIELLRELNKTKDALIEALKAQPQEHFICVPQPYPYPVYPPYGWHTWPTYPNPYPTWTYIAGSTQSIGNGADGQTLSMDASGVLTWSNS